MENIIIYLVSATLLVILTFLFLYFKNEKANKQTQETIKNFLEEFKRLLINTASDLSNRFEEQRKEVKISQDQTNSKMNSGFEELERDNKEIRKEASNYVSKLQQTFKDYADRVDKLLMKYSEDNLNSQKETNQLKLQIQQELQNLLKEIKAPLDLE
jgi:hypothetical protein